jgi:hypothetical protein
MIPHSSSVEVSETIGRLCVSGDWACARGDFVGLGQIALQLADFAPEPFHCELAELAATCNTNPERAVTLWDRVKTKLYREARA